MKKDDGCLAPLAPELWPRELEDIRGDLGQPLNIHQVMAHHAALTRAWMPFRNYIVANSSLEPRHRELLVLRTAVNCGAGYEWAHHVVRGREAGLSDDEIQRVKQGAEAPQWSPVDRSLLKAADECHASTGISDETFRVLRAFFDAEQQLDIIATVGMYITLAIIIKTYRVPLEENGRDERG